MNNYIHCNNDVLNVDITAEELFKAAKGLKNKKNHVVLMDIFLILK
jgi:hypothetical protein